MDKTIHISITTLNNLESSLSIYYDNEFHSEYWIENNFLSFILYNNKLESVIEKLMK